MVSAALRPKIDAGGGCVGFGAFVLSQSDVSCRGSQGNLHCLPNLAARCK